MYDKKKDGLCGKGYRNRIEFLPDEFLLEIVLEGRDGSSLQWEKTQGFSTDRHVER